MVIGHKGAGKSTTTGFLVYNCEEIDESNKDILERHAEGDKAVRNYVWVLKNFLNGVEGNPQQIKTGKWVVDISILSVYDKFIKKIMAGLCFDKICNENLIRL